MNLPFLVSKYGPEAKQTHPRSEEAAGSEDPSIPLLWLSWSRLLLPFLLFSNNRLVPL